MIRNIIRFLVVLGLVCIFTGGGVAVLYAVFKGDLARRENAAKEAAILAATPEGAKVDIQQPLAGEPFAPDAVYAARGADGKPVAYVAGGEATGYSSTVKVVVAAGAADLRILRVVVASQAETPGLGTRVAETKSTYTLWDKLFGAAEAERLLNPFLDQFAGKTPGEFKDVHAITAATITSNATKRAAEQAVERIRKAIEKPK
jgi:RnfABCDGE-type electron transport complex G subunit